MLFRSRRRRHRNGDTFLYRQPNDPALTHNVHRGSAALDEFYGSPTWDENIDLDELDVMSTIDCVLGQLFGRFGRGLDELDEVKPDMHIHNRSYEFGFAGGEHNQAWRQHITHRRTARRRELVDA